MKTSRFDPDSLTPWLSSIWPRDTAPHILAGVNDDDCAVLETQQGLLFVTTDFLNKSPIVEQLSIGNLWHLGRLTVAASLSDLCGSGAEPLGILVGAALREDDKTSDFMEFINGAAFEAKKWQTPVVGGDSKIGKERSFFSVGLGFCRSVQNAFLKLGAEPGDLIWVSGRVGSCAAATLGLASLDLGVAWKRWAHSALTEPEIPLVKSRALSASCHGNGGIDISDGIANDLSRLCSASSTGALLYAHLLPLHQNVRPVATAYNVAPWSIAFGSGGDFQFLATTARKHRDSMLQLGFYEIGVITEEQGVFLCGPNSSRAPLPELGHRDARGTSFAAEIEHIAREVNALVTS